MFFGSSSRHGIWIFENGLMFGHEGDFLEWNFSKMVDIMVLDLGPGNHERDLCQGWD